MNSMPADPGHASALGDIFGVTGASWFLDKASRELERYLGSDSAQERTDNLLNFCSTLISLEDWTYPGPPEDLAQWKAKHRSTCSDHSVVVLIALIAKHRAVTDGRFRTLKLESADEISIWTEAPTPDVVIEWVKNELPNSEVLSVRAVIEDDEISGYSVLVRIKGLKVSGAIVPMPTLLANALNYWRKLLGAR